MPNDLLLTSADAAIRLSVGVTAVKRWADEGRLACVRTAGGHRRFRLSDIERLRRGTGAVEDEWDTWIDTLVNSADVYSVLAPLFAERARLGAWFRVATRVGELLERIGDRWERGTISVPEEHAASAVLQRALAMAAESIPVSPDAQRCLVASAEGDDHTLGLSLAELCLREAGWRVEWAGRDTRSSDICERVRRHSVQMVAISATSLMSDRKALRTQVREVGRACQRAGVSLILGGAGAWPEPPEFGNRLSRWEDFSRLLQSFHSARRPPASAT